MEKIAANQGDIYNLQWFYFSYAFAYSIGRGVNGMN
jgi:hypothetical protein